MWLVCGWGTTNDFKFEMFKYVGRSQCKHTYIRTFCLQPATQPTLNALEVDRAAVALATGSDSAHIWESTTIPVAANSGYKLAQEM